MDSQEEALGMHSLGDKYVSNARDVPASSSKKRDRMRGTHSFGVTDVSSTRDVLISSKKRSRTRSMHSFKNTDANNARDVPASSPKKRGRTRGMRSFKVADASNSARDVPASSSKKRGRSRVMHPFGDTYVSNARDASPSSSKKRGHKGGMQSFEDSDVSNVRDVPDSSSKRRGHTGVMPSFGDADVSNATDVPASSSKKRGCTWGAPLDVQPESKKILRTNEHGQPNEECSNHREFATHVGVLARTRIRIIYENFRQVPERDIKEVTDILSRFYEFEHQSWEASVEYIKKRINETWRNYKMRLTAKYIKDKDPAIVRNGPVPPGVPIEDWRVFVDQRNTEQFKLASARNKINRAKLKGPACLGRRSMAVLCHKMAVERNLASDAEVGRIEVYLKAHTRKDNVAQFPDLVEKLNELYDIDPASRMTNVDDALAQLVGPDNKGQMRGLGCSIGKIGFKKSAPARSKVVALTKERKSLVDEILEIKETLNTMKSWEQTMADIKAWYEAQSSQNPSPLSAARCTQASSTGFKKSAPAHSKVDTLTKEKKSMADEILEIKETLNTMKTWELTVANIMALREAQSSQNRPPISTTRSTKALLPDVTYIGKRCELLGWGKRGVVARGKVHKVVPGVIIHGQPLEKGAFVVAVTEIVQPNAPLWKEDGFACTLEEAGVGSILQWGKDSLRVK